MIIFLYGPDTYRSRRQLNELKKNFASKVDPSESSISVIDGENGRLKDLSEKINTSSLFVKKRMVIIENIFRNKAESIFSELLEYLRKQKLAEEGDRDVLVFYENSLDQKNKPLKAKQKELFSFLAKQPFSQEYKTLTPIQLTKFIKEEFATFNRLIKPNAINELINCHQGDLWTIANEIHKLCNFKTEGEITIEDVAAIGSRAYSEDIFSLTDAVASRKPGLTLKIFEEQLAAGLSIEMISSMLMRHVKTMIQMKSKAAEKLPAGELAREFGLHPYAATKAIRQAENFTLAELSEIFQELIEIDFRNKTGSGDLKTGLTMLIARI